MSTSSLLLHAVPAATVISSVEHRAISDYYGRGEEVSGVGSGCHRLCPWLTK